MVSSSSKTFTLPKSAEGEQNVLVSLPDDLEKDQLLEFPAFKNWIKNLRHNLRLQKSSTDHEFHNEPYSLRSINVQAVDWFGGGKKLGFVKMQVEVKNDNDEGLSGCVFLRGPSVAMLVILQPDDVPEFSQNEKHVILSVQPRIPSGGLGFVELPAGMVDDSGTFSGAAAKEIKEEIGLEIPESELTNLTELAIPSNTRDLLELGMYPSVGGCDEYVLIFLHEKRVPRHQLKEWTGKLTGLRDEGEKITLKLVRLEDLWAEGARDAKALGAWALYEGCRRTGKI